MKWTFHERQELALRFADDVTRMRYCLDAEGRKAEDDDIVFAWASYCDDCCAGWLRLPEKDDELLAILLKHLPVYSWQTTILDAGDGSGDGVLELPDELLAKLGWAEGDSLYITKAETNALILRRVE